jgi:hypothetical protein
MVFVPGDICRVNLQWCAPQHRDGAPVWDFQPWRGTAVIRWRLPEGTLLLVLEHARRAAEDPTSGASLILSPASGITGWVMDAYLEPLSDVREQEAVV